MTLRNEIFEGIGAYKGVKEAMGDTPRDRYYEALASKEQIPVDEYLARKKAREAAIRRGRPGTRMPQVQLPTIASTATPGAPTTPRPTAPPQQTAFIPTATPAQATPGILNFNYQEGGMVLDERGMPYRESQRFDPEGDGYDYDQARAAGLGPGKDGHWPSREPKSGLQLKGRKHPTWDKAIETDRMAGYGLDKRNGRYYTQKFADGGMVDDEADQSEADLIVRSLISRDLGDPVGTNEIGAPNDLPPPDFRSEGNRQLQEGTPEARDTAAREKINRQVDEPWTVTGPASEYQTQGMRDRADLEHTQAMDATRMVESAPEAKGRSRLQRATDWMKPDPAAMGQAQRRRTLRKEINRNEPGLTEALTDSELRQREEKTRELRGQIGQSAAYGGPDMPDIGALVPNAPSLGGVPAAVRSVINLDGFKGGGEDPKGTVTIGAKPAAPGADTTPAADLEVNETGGTPEGTPPQGPYPVQPQPVPTPVPGPNTASAMSPESAAAAQGDRPGNTRAPNQTPTGPAVATNGAAVPATSNGPPNTTQSGPTGTTASPAPPMGSAGVNTPSTAPKPTQTALNVAPPPAMRGGLGDQSRTKAYDPVADANDPGNKRPVDASGRSYNPQEIQQVLSGAAQFANPDRGTAMTQVGSGAVTRQNFNSYVDRHSQGGAFSPGEAMLVGMLSDYKMLLSQGHVDQANKMAFGLIQAASIEAASYGYVARDQFKAGDYKGALQNAVAGANYIPDGMSFKVGPDGRSIVAMNGQGQVTAQQAVTPQQLFAMITGLASGDMIWQALQMSASALTKPDKNAEGRDLSNRIKRNSLLLQEQRLKKGAGGGKGTAGLSPAAAEAAARLAALGGGVPQAPTVVVNQQGSDDGDPGAAVVAGERFDDD